MKKLLLISLLSLALLLCSCRTPTQRNVNFPSILASVNHQVWFRSGDTCNSTSIGPHSILTATHCIKNEDDATIAIDSKSRNVSVIQKIQDKQDHVILVLGYTFKNWASISTQPIILGQKVFIAGAPGDFDPLYRVGVYSGWTRLDAHTVMMLFQIPIFYGDSGSAIFNQQGQIITTVTCNASLVGDHDYVGFACANPLAFTKQQLEQIQ